MAHETAHKKMPTRPVLLVMQWNEWAARAGVEVPRPPADLQGRPRKQDERHTARTPPLSGGGGWVLAVGPLGGGGAHILRLMSFMSSAREMRRSVSSITSSQVPSPAILTPVTCCLGPQPEVIGAVMWWDSPCLTPVTLVEFADSKR